MTPLTLGATRERPASMADLPWYRKRPLQLWLLLIAALGGFVAVRTYAGWYVTLLQSIAAVKNAYDSVIPVKWIRHLVARDLTEKSYAFMTVQIIVYYFAKHWPRPGPNRWDKVERVLHVPNERIENQGIGTLLMGLIWAPIYFLPGEFVIVGILWLTHQNATEPKAWQIVVGGLAGSFLFGRRIAKGYAYHLQRLIIRERLLNGKLTPAWWMLWPIQRRFEWDAKRWNGQTESRWKHRRLQRFVHATTAALIILALLWLTYVGWYAMKYFTFSYAEPFHNLHFNLPDLWQHVL